MRQATRDNVIVVPTQGQQSSAPAWFALVQSAGPDAKVDAGSIVLVDARGDCSPDPLKMVDPGSGDEFFVVKGHQIVVVGYSND
jgi:hypothetical protein